MGTYVVAGKADCPHYAKAELLADLLQKRLPDFRIHKISVHPNEWRQWLETICNTNGWKHDCSPLVWRELVDRGGKGMLLGGFSDFMEHAQGYYGITSDMTTDLMLKIAEENLRSQELCMQEEQRQISMLQPLHVWISSALHPTCYQLIPLLITDETFPSSPLISLHLLDIEGDEEALNGLRMEVEDLSLSQLFKVTVHNYLDEQVFLQAHFIIFLDDWDAEHQEEVNTGEEDQAVWMRRVAKDYQQYGMLINSRAQKNVRVIVSGQSLVNLKCSLLLENTPSVSPDNFVAVGTQLEYEARAQIAKRFGVHSSDVTNIIIWGNISGKFHMDLQRARVFRYEGAISGPANFSLPLQEIKSMRKSMETEIMHLLRSQRPAVTKRAAAISETNAILVILKAWNNSTPTGEVFSLGVMSTGMYGIPEGQVFAVPVAFNNGRWVVWPDLTLGEDLRIDIDAAVCDIKKEKEFAESA